MALDILHDSWGPYTHTEVENALKSYLAVLEGRINQAIQEGGVGLTGLSQEVQALLAKANTALQPENLAAWAKAQNKPGYTADEITGITGFQNLLAKLQDMDAKIQAAAASGGVDPDDEMSSTSENVVQNKVIKAFVEAFVSQAISNLINGAPAALDTLKELADKLGDNDDAIAALTNLIATKANADDVLTALNQKQNTLTFDDAPTAGSNNPVKSGGIKTAIDNVTPTIDANGKWVIGGVTTDKDAQGPRGNTVLVNENAVGIQALIVNNFVDGGETDILSAEMGKVLRINVMKIFNALGVYAFPEGKPVLSWGSTVINHDINTNGVTGGLTISDVEVDGSSVQPMPQQVADGKSLSFKLNLPSGVSAHYRDVSIKMDGNEISSDSNVWNPNTGLVTISSVLGVIVVAANCMVDIEYLQSTGEQAIQTGIVPSTNFKCEIDAQFTEVASWKRLVASFGTTASSDLDGKWSTVLGFTADPKAYAQYGGYFAAITGTFTNRMTYISSLANNQVKLEAGGVSATAVYEGTHCISPLGLFAQWRSDNTFSSHCKAKVYYCKMWNNNVLVRHFVPVRIGQVGYMLDNVSGELFENLGTGSFVLGNDVTI